MRFTRPQLWRLLFTLLFLVTSIAVSVAAANPDHAHRGASQHDCIVCQAGHLPLVQASASPQVQPIRVVAEAVADLQVRFHAEYFGSSAPSRAPPAQPANR